MITGFIIGFIAGIISGFAVHAVIIRWAVKNGIIFLNKTTINQKRGAK